MSLAQIDLRFEADRHEIEYRDEVGINLGSPPPTTAIWTFRVRCIKVSIWKGKGRRRRCSFESLGLVGVRSPVLTMGE